MLLWTPVLRCGARDCDFSLRFSYGFVVYRRTCVDREIVHTVPIMRWRFCFCGHLSVYVLLSYSLNLLHLLCSMFHVKAKLADTNRQLEGSKAIQDALQSELNTTLAAYAQSKEGNQKLIQVSRVQHIFVHVQHPEP